MICRSARCQAPERGANYLLGDLLENYASNPDDSEQDRADKPRVMSLLPASGNLSWGRGGPWQVDKIKGLGTSHFAFSLPSLWVESQGMYLSFCFNSDLYYLAWIVFSTKHSLKVPPSWGVWGGNLFFYTAALILHCSFSRHNQSLHLSPSRLIHLLHLIRAHLLLLSGSGVPCPGPNSCPKRRLGNTLDELKLPPCSVALVLDSDGLP